MTVTRYRQQIKERKLYSVDFSKWLGAGEIITQVDTLVSDPALIVNPVTILPGNQSISYAVSGGVDGGRYDVSLLAHTSTDQRREFDVSFSTREIGV